MTDGSHIGRRLREIRASKGLSLRVTADLAGFSESYLSLIERGLRPVEKRSTLEALANALQVAPSELARTPLTAGMSESQAATNFRKALLGVTPNNVDGEPPSWPQVQARVIQLYTLRCRADYNKVGELLPALLRDLWVSTKGPHRREALEGLAECYTSSISACKNLGYPDLAAIAALRIETIAQTLSGPEWTGLAAYTYAQATGPGARQEATQIVIRAADEIAGELDRPEVTEIYGMLHLMAALGYTTQGQLDEAKEHEAEAARIAERPDANQNRMRLSFGAGNVGFWQTALAVERGEGGKAVELARSIDPKTYPEAPSRQAAWWIDVGRAFATERKHRDEAIRAFRTAEDIAPQLTRANPWVRETVTNLLSRARRDAGGRELRGLAYRIGLPV